MRLIARSFLCAVVLLAACTRHKIAESSTPEGEQVFVRVTNDNPNLVRMLVSAGGLEQWIGNVSGNETGRFTVPSMMLQAANQLAFTAENVVTGARFRTPNLVVRPGNVVYIEVSTRMNTSTWRVE